MLSHTPTLCFCLIALSGVAQSQAAPNFPVLIGPGSAGPQTVQVVFPPPIIPVSGPTESPLLYPSSNTPFSNEIPFQLFPPPPNSEEPFRKKNRPLVMGYYSDWEASSLPPEKVDFTRFDWIDYAFAIPKNLSLTWDDPEMSPQFLQRLVDAAHRKGARVKLSIGGWSGSQQFSSAVSPENRTTFVANIVGAYNKYKVDGIDIDWEYPGHQGEGDNAVSPNDSANFLLFLQLLRSELTPQAKITAAVLPTPFFGPDGNPMNNMSDFATVLDWVTLMNYDVWGSSPNPGPNAPLSDACGNSSQPEASAKAGVRAWTAAGFPASKLVLGVPSYGYLSHSTATRLRTRQTASRTQSVKLKGDGDQIQFCDLVQQGALVRSDESNDFGPLYNGTGGFTRYWDPCSNTPFLRSNWSRQVVTYDDVESLGLKADFARKKGLCGVNMFDLRGDFDWVLTDAVRNALGL
ncbi:glycoside hydrolase [Mycena pura]|uniref:Glycoside hydrolase n=1 Tax=Mycena pura TaxID=153505 RepID=A0AAD6YT68_9AGAR|nr:glycoside hydrolase [Mycena pura]